MSTSAASHLSPAFPERAAWGTAAKLRAWQQEALTAYLEADSSDFLAVATPGAGKTTYALRIAAELLESGEVEAITVIAPTEHLKTQWSEAAARVGIQLDPRFANSTAVHSREYDGVALTYAQVASRPDLHRRRTGSSPTFVIRQIHHGEYAAAWSTLSVRPRSRDPGLSLTGTPFRPTPADPVRRTIWTMRSSCVRRGNTYVSRRCGTACESRAVPATAVPCGGHKAATHRRPPHRARR